MKVVVFTQNNARILKNPTLDVVAQITAPYVTDPDLSHVEGYPPHHWKLVDGEVLPMTDAEIRHRDAHIQAFGVDNSLALVAVEIPKWKVALKRVLFFMAKLLLKAAQGVGA
jgi:hypothetical protein